MANSKIKRSDIISDDALKAPAEIAKGLADCRKQLKAIQKDLGWYPKNSMPVPPSKRQEEVVIHYTFADGFIFGLLGGCLVGLLAAIALVVL